MAGLGPVLRAMEGIKWPLGGWAIRPDGRHRWVWREPKSLANHLVHSFYQFGGFNFEGMSELHDIYQAHIPLSALHTTDIITVKIS
jgi:hypothetical protein